MVGFPSAEASSTYEGAPGYTAKHATSAGSGYWCSSGNHSNEQVVTWTGVLRSRRKAEGIKVDWAYSPDEVKILTSPDGLNFEEATCWQPSTRDDVAYQQTITFDAPRNVKAVSVAMRGPRAWKYFGISEAALVSPPGEPVMLVSGITSPQGEQCLVAQGEDSVGMENCMTAREADDDRAIFKINEEGQLEQIDDGVCVATAGDSPGAGRPVKLVDCEEALKDGNGTSQWEVDGAGQLRMSKHYHLCMVPQGNEMVVQECEKAALSVDARDKWFLTAPGEFDAAVKDNVESAVVAA